MPKGIFMSLPIVLTVQKLKKNENSKNNSSNDNRYRYLVL